MKLKNFIKSTWELPQNLLGALVVKIFNAKYDSTYEDATIFTWNQDGGMSLGKYIFLPFKTNTTIVDGTIKRDLTRYQLEVLKHEYGHTIQSKYLGWFYLLVVGLPSFIWANCFVEYRRKTGKDYYSVFPENWANKLGGVNKK